jgi:dTDP-glucose 4,6-dehydratase
VTILVTGGCGFIGSNFIELLVNTYPDERVVNVDALTYAGNRANLKETLSSDRVAAGGRYRFVHADICERDALTAVFREESPRWVVHFAAESHVDRSIEGPAAFVRTNVQGTATLLEVARQVGVERFVHVSTDEVYGSLGPSDPPFRETTPLSPRSPYSASKAGSDLLALAYVETYGFPAVVTRCSNNYGPYQFPEKLIPLMILNALRDLPLPVYGDGQQVRDWIHVHDHCRAVDSVLRRGRIGAVYNIGGECERTNLEIVHAVVELLGKPASLIRHVADRPGHDRRYAMAIDKIRDELGWRPAVRFAEGLKSTVDWYLAHPRWWQDILSGEYRSYYDAQYSERRTSARP